MILLLAEIFDWETDRHGENRFSKSLIPVYNKADYSVILKNNQGDVVGHKMVKAWRKNSQTFASFYFFIFVNTSRHSA